MAGIGVVTHDSSIDNLLTGTFPSPEHYLRTFSRLGKLPVENENIRKTDTLGQFFQPGVLPQAFLQFPQIINSMLQSNKIVQSLFPLQICVKFLLYFDFGGLPQVPAGWILLGPSLLKQSLPRQGASFKDN